MNKNSYIIIVAIIALVGVGALYVFKNNKESSVTGKQDLQNTSLPEVRNENVPSDTTPDSRYIVYSKNALDQSADKRRVLFFYASWCPICRPVDQALMKNPDKIPSDVVIIRVNYNDPDTDQEEKDLAVKYGVTYQHTFVQIDDKGNKITTWNGGQTEELLANIK